MQVHSRAAREGGRPRSTRGLRGQGRDGEGRGDGGGAARTPRSPARLSGGHAPCERRPPRRRACADLQLQAAPTPSDTTDLVSAAPGRRRSVPRGRAPRTLRPLPAPGAGPAATPSAARSGSGRGPRGVDEPMRRDAPSLMPLRGNLVLQLERRPHAISRLRH